MWLAIDGYNVIAEMTGEPLNRLDLEAERDQLNQLLFQYRSLSKHRLTVVYDGGRISSGEPRQYSEKGVKVLFSSLGRNADQVLIQMAKQYGSGLTVVTSDREVAERSENCGAVVLASGEFCQRLLMALDGSDDNPDEDEPITTQRRHLTEKKGNPHRLSKKERQRNRRLDSV
ncbi:MAG: NYN domain-containing protein [Deltaproteobacteria bacterium]|nr:NYN domain-containing protein [Deltaproteobacteria bacterium]